MNTKELARVLIVLLVILFGASCAGGVLLGGGLSDNIVLSHNHVDLNSHNVTVTTNTATYAPVTTQPQPDDGWTLGQSLLALIMGAFAALGAMMVMHAVLEHANA